MKYCLRYKYIHVVKKYLLCSWSNPSSTKACKHLITLYALLHIFNWFIRNVIFKWKHPSDVMRPIYYTVVWIYFVVVYSRTFVVEWNGIPHQSLRDGVIYILSDAFKCVYVGIWCILLYNAILYSRLYSIVVLQNVVCF